MKYLFTALIACFLYTEHASAQAWSKDRKVISVGIGAANFYHIGKTRTSVFGPFASYYAPVTGQLNIEGEFGVHDYVGVGFNTGIGGGRGILAGYSGSLTVPIGVLANFHFFQLIADKTGKNLHTDVLDIFVGASLGSGVGVIFYTNTNVENRVMPLVYGGVHAGIRWYFSEKVGITGQFGFGKQLIDVGVVFKL